MKENVRMMTNTSNCITNACELELQIGYHDAGKQITADWNKCTLQTHE